MASRSHLTRRLTVTRNFSRNASTFQHTPLIINGKNVTSETKFDVISPVTNEKSSECSSASLNHVRAAVDGAQKAFGSWKKTKPQHRRDLFLTAADIMQKRKPELSQIIHEEIGADQHYQDFIIGLGVEGLRDTAGRIAGACQGHVPDVIQEGMRGMILKRPYGVNLGIAPW
jgi:acyl-CoA reductase-like NAD-dependent aldehyde dehydrogenase